MWPRKQQSVTVLENCINNENLQMDIGLLRSKLYITSIFSRLAQPKELNHFYRVHNHLLATETWLEIYGDYHKTQHLAILSLRY